MGLLDTLSDIRQIMKHGVTPGAALPGVMDALRRAHHKQARIIYGSRDTGSPYEHEVTGYLEFKGAFGYIGQHMIVENAIIAIESPPGVYIFKAPNFRPPGPG